MSQETANPIERIVYSICEETIQQIAESNIKRRLTEEEIESVVDVLFTGVPGHCEIDDVIYNSILDVVENPES